ncbi:FAD-dependent oxidoreductase [Aspergillus saccharolyticus JOP 1030-1]|uniref:FAD/NAD(P)-binding domain-containing protein n=1 Tax=Aspergillus saccharolyticus JOP 1030-1 TaxID=1450539 RepID=A0A318Z7J7_9EURO|nr:FAD/NAD(P)-binding domain-containing protein [Aspergillus saccharolyticus JOP 1030-1]PYH42394.1 FAD/NAD(P)-binding domain-containing protein [Aspergillus saccharolyticus JOP 1030-1]
MSTETYAIIGAGLSGLTLALALHQQCPGSSTTIYESRPAALDIGGAITLSPNALRILDRLGIYSRFRQQAYEFDTLHYRTSTNQPLDTYEFGSAPKYGYRGMRIYRHAAINILTELVAEAGGIQVHYNKKFARVVAETREEVVFGFADGATARARYLLGADGIHSAVRGYLFPDLGVEFMGAVAVTATVPTQQLYTGRGGGGAEGEESADGEWPLPVTIMNRKYGAFVIAPQRKDGEEVLIGRQKRMDRPRDRAGWAALLNGEGQEGNKEWCVDFLREGVEEFPAIVQRAVQRIDPDTVNLWPFYRVPQLERWTSTKMSREQEQEQEQQYGRVVILGDAAHAIPPSAGQGVNQAIEDVYTFALIAGRGEKAGTGWEEGRAKAWKAWQAGRQARVDRVLELNAKVDSRRMIPLQEGDQEQGVAVEVEMEPFELGWLYQPDFEVMVDEWLAAEGVTFGL